MGLRKGQTNNPKGRPKGSTNNISSELKEKLTGMLANNFESFEEDIKAIEKPEVRANLYVKALALVVARPKDEDEKEIERQTTLLMAKLFQTDQ